MQNIADWGGRRKPGKMGHHTTIEGCPYCGKIFMASDENGCLIEDFARCDDVIGEGDSGEYYFTRGFDIFHEIMKLYDSIPKTEGISNYINHLTGVAFEAWNMCRLSSFIESLDEVYTSSHVWDGGGPMNTGLYSIFIVKTELQADLLAKLRVVMDRLEAYTKAPGSKLSVVWTRGQGKKKDPPALRRPADQLD